MTADSLIRSVADAFRRGSGSANNLPPARLRHRVAGNTDPAWFIEGGQEAAKQIEAIITERIPGLTVPIRVLDFGAGCGRVSRHLVQHPDLQVRASDLDTRLIAWVAKHLPLEADTNDPLPPLKEPDGRFDAIIVLSVLTHMDAVAQRAWLAEFRRLLTALGVLIISIHGESAALGLPQSYKDTFDRDQELVVNADAEFTSWCCSYHSEAAVRSLVSGIFTVDRFLPHGAAGNPPQDLWILRPALEPS
jgi:SAM-dependent methyltransferase